MPTKTCRALSFCAVLFTAILILQFAHAHNQQVGLNAHGEFDHDHAHGHGHSHDGGHGHGHSHDAGHGHGHSHDGGHGHGHSHGAGHGHGHSHGNPPSNGKSWVKVTNLNKKPESAQLLAEQKYNLLVQAATATLLISVAPLLVLLVFPSQPSSRLLKVMLAFTAGGLLGDVFLHLLPHAGMGGDAHGHGHAHAHAHGEQHGHGHSHGHSHENSLGLWILGGIVAFFVMDKLVRLATGGEHAHSHSHSHPEKQQQQQPAATTPAAGSSEKPKKKQADKTNAPQKGNQNKDAAKSSQKQVDKKQPSAPHIKPAAWLNLIADFLHNFTDGLAIGASFVAGETVGASTTFAVLLHELPHEIGDFAILVQSGMSRKSAILMQLSTATGAFLGSCVGVLLESNGVDGAASAPWILPLTAGGFIYVACTAVLPELLEDSGSFFQLLLEIFAFGVGVCLMLGIAALE